MNSTEVLGFLGVAAFLGVVFYALHRAQVSTRENEAKEQAFLDATSVDVTQEDGSLLTILRSSLPEAQPDTTANGPSEPSENPVQ